MIYTARGGSLRALAVPLIVSLLTSCAYVSKSEYCEYWDKDGDGWPIGEDCDDTNPDRYPYAPDIRGDGCDSDCLELTDDRDGDDWPDGADCDGDDPNIYPCAPDDPDDDVDSDCDGRTEPREDECPTVDPDFPGTTSVSCASNPDLETSPGDCATGGDGGDDGRDAGSEAAR